MVATQVDADVVHWQTGLNLSIGAKALSAVGSQDIAPRGRFYLGLVTQGGRGHEERAGRHPPIIDEAIWYARFTGYAPSAADDRGPDKHRTHLAPPDGNRPSVTTALAERLLAYS